MNGKYTNFIVTPEFEGKRLLSFLKENLSMKVDDIRFAITHHRCRVNGTIERFESKKVKKGDQIEIYVEKKPDFAFDQERVIFEDEFILIYNKPAGIPVTETGGLAEMLKLFPAHRIDRDTTGLLLFVKKKEHLASFEALFKERKIEKSYLAIVFPPPEEKKGIIEKKLVKSGFKEGIVKWQTSTTKGIEAKTTWRVEKWGKDFAMLRCFPITGRTHQIRVHLNSIGHPILGDVQYATRKSHFLLSPFRPLLHAEMLSFFHPLSKKKVFAKAPLPADFLEALNYF